MVLRFSEDEIEIPVDLVTSDRDSLEAQRVQGWKQRNPCFPGR
jgi:hypothetical protein